MAASPKEKPSKPGKISPDLIQQRSRAMAALASARMNWPGDFSTIELVPAAFGLMVCGVRGRLEAVRMLAILRNTFPDWANFSLFEHDDGRDPGWRVKIARERETS